MRTVFLLTASLIAGAALPALASPITVYYTGTVSSLTFHKPMPDFWDSEPEPDSITGYDGSFAVGSLFSGSITFDRSIPDRDPGATYGRYGLDSDLAPWAATLTVGSYAFSFGNRYSDLFVSNDSGTPPASVDSVSFYLDGFYPRSFYPWEVRFVLSLRDSVMAAALSSDRLDSVPFALASWPEARVTFTSGQSLDTADFTGSGTLQSLYSVPEPSGLFLLLLGMASLRIARSR